MKSHKELDSSLAEAMIVTIRLPLLVLNGELRVERANPAFYDLFKVTPGQTSGRLIYDLGDGQWNIPALRHLLEAILGGEEHVEDYGVEHEFEDIGRRIMLLNARRIESEEARPYLILLAINDVTDREQARFELEGQKEYAEKLSDSVREAMIVLGWDLRVKHANKTFYEAFQVRPEETEGQMIYDLGNGQWNVPRLRLTQARCFCKPRGARTKPCGRFLVGRCVPSPRRASGAPAARKKLVHQPRNTFSTASTPCGRRLCIAAFATSWLSLGGEDRSRATAAMSSRGRRT